jgi:hypothetical protein
MQPFNDMVREPSPGLDFVMMPAASLRLPSGDPGPPPDDKVTPNGGDSRREDNPIAAVTRKADTSESWWMCTIRLTIWQGPSSCPGSVG